MNNNTAIDSFLQRKNTGHAPILIFAFILLIMFGGFSFLTIRLVTAFETRPRFTVLGHDGTLLVTQELGFMEAKAVHIAQAELAAQTIFNRSPKALDSEERAKRLFGRDAYQQLEDLVEAQTPEFEAKNLHQKVEVSSVNLVKLQDRSVRVTVYGQLLRVGDYGGQTINEASNVMVSFLFVYNQALLGNGLFPTVVTEFDIKTQPIPAQ